MPLGSIKSNFSLTTSLANIRMCHYVPKKARRYERWSLPTRMSLPQLVLTSDVWEPGTDISCHVYPVRLWILALAIVCTFPSRIFSPLDSCPPFTLPSTVSIPQLTGFFCLHLDWAHVLMLRQQEALSSTGPSWQPLKKDTFRYHTSPSVGIDSPWLSFCAIEKVS